MWFKDHQTVLVYHPGSGGEYICSKLNVQKLLLDKFNKHRCFNSFPGNDKLYELVSVQEAVNWEWTEECRLKLRSEKQLQEIVNKDKDWHYVSGNPDRNKPRLGQRSLMENCNHFPTHWCYGLFREPVYKWIDCDNDYWLLHWDLVLDIKDRYFESAIQQSVGKWMKYREASKDHFSFDKRYKRYREYYNTRFPNSRISIDDLDFQTKTDYKAWALKNLAVAKKMLEKYNIRSQWTDKVFDDFPL